MPFGGYLHEVIKPQQTQKALNTANCVLDPSVEFNVNCIRKRGRILHAGNTSTFFWLAGFQPEHYWAPSLRIERKKIYLKISQKPVTKMKDLFLQEKGIWYSGILETEGEFYEIGMFFPHFSWL